MYEEYLRDLGYGPTVDLVNVVLNLIEAWFI
jgi:hypothetical protein